ncbi:hypothetical protein WUBG_02968 [Wuchereria bancrofti]|uniref:Uncharacterized protein n=1 Tax=Wuchereria bancrofti TaxID=6293 RepID=J9F9B4_WUCBA|nr:hypothetical protein WUBG_02968 [Wuchereria bancrofti]
MSLIETFLHYAEEMKNIHEIYFHSSCDSRKYVCARDQKPLILFSSLSLSIVLIIFDLAIRYDMVQLTSILLSSIQLSNTEDIAEENDFNLWESCHQAIEYCWEKT